MMIKTPLSTMIGGAFWTPGCTIIGGASKTLNQLIKYLFANNEQGFAYDPNDLTTMYQDAAGTIPVTGAGQPVGLMLDKSKGLVLEGELWADGAVRLSGESQRISSGVYRVYSSAGAYSSLSIANSLVVGSLYKLTFNIDSITTLGAGLTNEGSPASLFNTLGRKTVYFFATSPTFVIKRAATACDILVSGFSLKKIAGNHAYQTTSASRPILRQNAITGAYYLEFDGSDDFLRTSNIDFTATDKVSLFTGLRKLRDSTAESILESGVLPYDGVGTFWLTTNALAPGDVWIAIAQSWNARTGFSKITPVANNFVFSAKLDFAGSVATDEVKPRLNGSTAGFTRGLLEHAGTGNFGNHPLYIGSRAGTSLQFNGHLYSLIGVGRLTTDNETTALEELIAKRTGVTLS